MAWKVIGSSRDAIVLLLNGNVMPINCVLGHCAHAHTTMLSTLIEEIFLQRTEATAKTQLEKG